jgi:UDP-N-acetylglucosamine transferase subunit ALG13
VIFVTVGTQLPFDRLVGAVDTWAAARPGREVVAQVGPTERQFGALRAEPFLTPERFEELFASAELVVAHAGMGTILSAMERGKPLLVVPRRAALGEHRNEHQLATATRLEARLGLAVAWGEAEVGPRIDAMLAQGHAAAPRISPYADGRLIGFVRSFAFGAPAEARGLSAESPSR